VYAHRLILAARRDSLGDEGFHHIFEAFFRSVQIERTIYINSSTTSRSSLATNRLIDCASVFRLAVDLGVREISSRTVTAVIDHVLDTLPVSGQVFCVPLIDGYLKILRTILGHKAHVEHLREKRWCSIADFLTEAISRHALDEADESSPGTATVLSPHSSGGHTRPFRVSQGGGARSTQHNLRRPPEELFFCLDSLTSATNAPIISKAAAIMECLIGFFKLTTSANLLHQEAFRCVNNVLSRIVTENSSLARKSLIEILPTVRAFWSTKNVKLRNEMSISLVLSSNIIQALPHTDPSDVVLSSLRNLADAIASEYDRRSERDLLQLDDLLFTNDRCMDVMALRGFRIRPENARATFNWGTINLLTLITLTMDSFPQMRHRDISGAATGKRRKLENGVDEVLHQAVLGGSPIKIRALQMIPFLLNSSPMVGEKIISLISEFTNQILDKDATVVSWTLVALSRYHSTLSISSEAQC
jgi:serine-protein kinase ATM